MCVQCACVAVSALKWLLFSSQKWEGAGSITAWRECVCVCVCVSRRGERDRSGWLCSLRGEGLLGTRRAKETDRGEKRDPGSPSTPGLGWRGGGDRDS